jgi:hypothetical protein
MSDVTPQTITKSIKSLERCKNDIARCSTRLTKILTDYKEYAAKEAAANAIDAAPVATAANTANTAVTEPYLVPINEKKLCTLVLKSLRLEGDDIRDFIRKPIKEQTFSALVDIVKVRAEKANLSTKPKSNIPTARSGVIREVSKRTPINSTEEERLSFSSYEEEDTSDNDNEGAYEDDIALDRMRPQFSGQCVRRNISALEKKLVRNQYIDVQYAMPSEGPGIDYANRVIVATGATHSSFCNRNLFHELTIFKVPVQFNLSEEHPIYAFGYGTFLLTISGEAYKYEAWFTPTVSFNIFQPLPLRKDFMMTMECLFKQGDWGNGIPLSLESRLMMKMRVQPDKYSKKIFTKKLEKWKKKQAMNLP